MLRVFWKRKLVPSIPTNHVGLALCSAADMSLTCFLSSCHAC